MKNKNIYLVFGQLSLVMSIILSHFLKDSGIVSLIIGIFLGLSIVFNFAFLVSLRKKK
ncbi:MAG: hypothetical protein WCO13_01365 [Bacteroidota bacterium]